jgi:hypothetical protein
MLLLSRVILLMMAVQPLLCQLLLWESRHSICADALLLLGVVSVVDGSGCSAAKHNLCLPNEGPSS